MSDLETSDETMQSEIPCPVTAGETAEIAPAPEPLPESQPEPAVIIGDNGPVEPVYSAAAANAAIVAEREACALLAETFSPSSPTWTDTRQGIADAIRVRSN